MVIFLLIVCPVIIAISWYILYKKELQVESDEDDDEDDFLLGG